MIVAVSTRHIDANARTQAHARRVARASAARLALPAPGVNPAQAAADRAARLERIRQVRLMRMERFLRTYGASRHAAEAGPLRRWERPSLRRVAARVCRTFGVSLEALKSDRRQADLVLAKQAFAYWSYTYTGQSLPAIGRFIGCDHTTILYSIRIFPEKRRARKEKRQTQEQAHADD